MQPSIPNLTPIGLVILIFGYPSIVYVLVQVFEFTFGYLLRVNPSSFNAEHYYPNQTQYYPGVVIATQVKTLIVSVQNVIYGSAY